jgi:transposase
MVDRYQNIIVGDVSSLKLERSWVCCDCGELHDRDVNAARNILIGSRCRTSVRGNEQPYLLAPPSNAYRVREAGTDAAKAAA